VRWPCTSAALGERNLERLLLRLRADAEREGEVGVESLAVQTHAIHDRVLKPHGEFVEQPRGVERAIDRQSATARRPER